MTRTAKSENETVLPFQVQEPVFHVAGVSWSTDHPAAVKTVFSGAVDPLTSTSALPLPVGAVAARAAGAVATAEAATAALTPATATAVIAADGSASPPAVSTGARTCRTERLSRRYARPGEGTRRTTATSAKRIARAPQSSDMTVAASQAPAPGRPGSRPGTPRQHPRDARCGTAQWRAGSGRPRYRAIAVPSAPVQP
jgi:hypothetical protein